jgi:NTP pyrophosphatase (non-canonical NTP hydrolase)
VDFDEYQKRSAETDIRPDPSDVAFPLLGLAGEVGELVAKYKKRLRQGKTSPQFAGDVQEDLGDLLWYAAALARTVDLSLSEIAEENLRKTSEAFGHLPPPRSYDSPFPPKERLPRDFTIAFVPELGSTDRVQMYFGSKRIGDPLDDNTRDEDFYRFHDAFHLANAAVLGWSPMLRRALGCKRKSNPETDRVEDGARAIFVEEAVIAYLFAKAEEVDFFEGATRVDWDLMKTLRHMTSHLEVHDQPPAAWQSTILQGFSAWRQLRDRGQGLLVGSLEDRTLRFVDTNTLVDVRSATHAT